MSRKFVDEEKCMNEEHIAEEAVAIPSESMQYRLEFTGTTAEYFRIWIVNTFLTIITLGIYAAWAKVRTRQYFYAHTGIGGHSFEYLANPMAILKGNLIIGGGFILYTAAGHYNQIAAGVIAVLFSLILPFLFYKTLRFYAHNSAFRNVRFRFSGTLGESYRIFLFLGLLIPLTLGLIFPYWSFRQKKYFFDNFAFGTSRNSFNGTPGTFYNVYLMASLILIGILAGAALVLYLVFQNFLSSASGAYIYFIPIFTYIILLIASVLIQQYIYARVNNYCWQESALGTIRFQSTLNPWQLMRIRVMNILGILVSCGLLIPWAKIRKSRYILDNLTIITQGGLDDFTAGAGDDESAVGEAATDFFDFEIGL